MLNSTVGLITEIGVSCKLKMKEEDVCEERRNNSSFTILTNPLTQDAGFYNPPCVLIKLKSGFSSPVIVFCELQQDHISIVINLSFNYQKHTTEAFLINL